MIKKWHWYFLSLIIVFLDQFSKYWAELKLTPYKPLAIFPMLNFTLAYNTGAAFSFLNGAGGWHRWLFAGFSLVMSIVLIIWLYKVPQQNKLLALGISCVLGGAVGNLIDRMGYGFVVDFIDVYYNYHHFATFNLADSAICIGAGIFILDIFKNQKSQ